MTASGLSLEERFLTHVYKTSNCWEWIGAKDRFGYGRFGLNKTSINAHRIAWIILKGDIPAGLLCLHKCDNPACVNPNHLYLGDYRDNANDKYSRGRAPNNVDYWRSRKSPKFLTDDQVTEIKALFATGKYTKAELGRLFNAHESHIGRIVRGERRNGKSNP